MFDLLDLLDLVRLTQLGSFRKQIGFEQHRLHALIANGYQGFDTVQVNHDAGVALCTDVTDQRVKAVHLAHCACRSAGITNDLEQGGEVSAYLDSLGWVLYKMGRFAEAEAMLRVAMLKQQQEQRQQRKGCRGSSCTSPCQQSATCCSRR